MHIQLDDSFTVEPLYAFRWYATSRWESINDIVVAVQGILLVDADYAKELQRLSPIRKVRVKYTQDTLFTIKDMGTQGLTVIDSMAMVDFYAQNLWREK
ncbi:MAG: hypothetical protein GY861_05845 [bacterium]|nr:hypothetical protein [bacterium]